MYRSIAQFGAWALARAQKEEIDIPENDASSTSSTASSMAANGHHAKRSPSPSPVGKAGDPLPPFHKHMIRQRVDRHGMTYPLDPLTSIPALQQPRSKVGAINPVIVKKWLGAKKTWDERFARQKLRVQQRRIKDFEHGYFGFDGETPPACAMASRRLEKDIAPPIKTRKSYAMMLWSMIASKHDKEMVENEEKADVVPHTSNIGVDGPGDSGVVTEKTSKPRDESLSEPESEHRGLSPMSNRKRSTSRSRIVSDAGQANDNDQGQKRPDLVAGDNFSYGAPEGTQDRPPCIGLRYASAGSGNVTPPILIAGVDTHADSRPSSRLENASTRAVLDEDGVITAVKGGSLLSPDFHSQYSAESTHEGKGAFPFQSAEAERPGMPNREEFITAEEYLEHE
jgi:hypothetical protein